MSELITLRAVVFRVAAWPLPAHCAKRVEHPDFDEGRGVGEEGKSGSCHNFIHLPSRENNFRPGLSNGYNNGCGEGAFTAR
jgi:hypothetical protein